MLCNLRFNVLHEIPAVFRNGSNCDYHFIIKESVTLIEKEVRKINKNDNEDIIAIFYKIKFIHSARFTTSSLSSLVNNLAEEIRKIKCRDCDFFHEYDSVKDNLIKYNYTYLAIQIIQIRLMKN